MVADVNFGDSIELFFDNLFEWLPRVVGFLAILLVGYFVAKIIGGLVGRVLERVGLDRWLHRGIGGSWLARVIQRPSRLLGTIVFWVIFVAAISIAVDVLGIEALEDAIRAVWGYVPNILAALLIFLIASAIAGAVAALVSRTMGDSPIARIIKTVAPTLIMAIAFFMILDQLKIAEDIVVITYAALVGAVALGMALAFGLGGREVAGEMLRGAYESGREAMPQARAEMQRAKERGSAMVDELREQAEEGRSGPRPEPPHPPGSRPLDEPA
jgi:Mechanosensitive ion channel, conserved TM helix